MAEAIGGCQIKFIEKTKPKRSVSIIERNIVSNQVSVFYDDLTDVIN
jgi:hypothetical protein